MKKLLIIFIFFGVKQILLAQLVYYSPAWFGPNAGPVADAEDGKISQSTKLDISAHQFYGNGNQTENLFLKIEVPIIPEKVSVRAWSTLLEHYQVSDEIITARHMQSGQNNGKANGDIYLQTRILLMKESKYQPDLVLQSTLKTASGNNFINRRYYDTPGYYFDIQAGKEFKLKNYILNKIRVVGNLGFLCWETTGSVQDDAPMYGLNLILANHWVEMSNSIGGYSGWLHLKYPGYGDSPLVYALNLTHKTNNINYWMGYQYGIKDYPYQHIQLGISFLIPKLTPDFKE